MNTITFKTTQQNVTMTINYSVRLQYNVKHHLHHYLQYTLTS